MGKIQAMTGNTAAYTGAALCRPDLIAAYPITPQSSVVEGLAGLVYNGDLGTIMSIDLYEQTVDVLFDDEREALYEFSQLEELELAYCISIHKSQGSEFPVVILPLAGGPPMLMTRNLLYTAVTRARKAVYIIGHEECPAQMVANNQVKQRYSALAAFMRADRGLQ